MRRGRGRRRWRCSRWRSSPSGKAAECRQRRRRSRGRPGFAGRRGSRAGRSPAPPAFSRSAVSSRSKLTAALLKGRILGFGVGEHLLARTGRCAANRGAACGPDIRSRSPRYKTAAHGGLTGWLLTLAKGSRTARSRGALARHRGACPCRRIEERSRWQTKSSQRIGGQSELGAFLSGAARWK